MKVIHAFWLPDATNAFRQGGSFRLWAETEQRRSAGDEKDISSHPFQLPRSDWPALLEVLGAKVKTTPPRNLLKPCKIQLPSTATAPLPSPQLAKYWPEAPEDTQASLQPWLVDCYLLDYPIRQLSEIHFLSFYQAEDIQPGSDFLFWYWFNQNLKRLLVRDQYLPALIYHQPPRPKGKRKLPERELYGGWEWASEPYERLIADARERMRDQLGADFEAQDIKNPMAAQSKAGLKLKARHRLALTGTPVENRLTDLWSIFNFINPGYLDTQAKFRNRFEIPV